MVTDYFNRLVLTDLLIFSLSIFSPLYCFTFFCFLQTYDLGQDCGLLSTSKCLLRIAPAKCQILNLLIQ